MAAKGAVEKDIITNKILETFEGAFIYGKEIRIPINDVQIKVALTCAKENVEVGGAQTPVAVVSDAGFPTVNTATKIEPTAEEMEQVRLLAEKLGL